MNKRVPQKDLDKFAEELERNSFNHPQVEVACRELGITVHQLLPKSSAEFEEASGPVQEVRLQHTEARRKAMVSLVAKFLVENSTAITSSKPHQTSISLSDWSAHRVDVEVKKMQKELRVRENLKALQVSHETRKREIQSRLDSRQQRASAEKQQLTEQMRVKAEERDLKIQSIIELKYKQVALHELRALKQNWHASPVRATRTPIKPRRPHTAAPSPDIDAKLRQFDEKMARSEVVRDQELRQRSSCGFREEHARAKARANKAELERRTEEQLVSQVLKLQAKEAESRQRRTEHLVHASERVKVARKSLPEADFIKVRERAAARKAKRIADARRRKLLQEEQQAATLAQRWQHKKLSAARELQRQREEDEIRRRRLIEKQFEAEEKVKRLKDAEDFVAKAKSAMFLTMQEVTN